MKCPGQDTKYWKPGDIFEVPCPECGELVEFFRDEASRICRKCHTKFRNPRIDLKCLEWCRFAEQCASGMDVPEKNPWGERPDKGHR